MGSYVHTFEGVTGKPCPSCGHEGLLSVEGTYGPNAVRVITHGDMAICVTSPQEWLLHVDPDGVWQLIRGGEIVELPGGRAGADG